MTIFPNPSQRKLAAMLTTEVLYILGSIATGVAVEGAIMLGIFTAFVAGNYGEHREGKNVNPG